MRFMAYEIYCDGSSRTVSPREVNDCDKNRIAEVHAGLGVFIRDTDTDETTRISGPVGKGLTNDVAELAAFIMAMTFVNADTKKRKTVIYSDAMYVVNSYNQFLPTWEKNGFIK